MTISAAAKQHLVPTKTLVNRIKGRVKHGTNPGPSTVPLLKKRMHWLPTYLLYMAECGFPLTVNIARGFALTASLRSGTSGRFNEETGPGKHWWSNFHSRHPELTLRTTDNLERTRVNALMKDVVEN